MVVDYEFQVRNFKLNEVHIVFFLHFTCILGLSCGVNANEITRFHQRRFFS